MAYSRITHDGEDFHFLTLQGQVATPSRVLSLMTRPGIDGIAARDEGRQGLPYRLLGVISDADVNEARAKVEAFKAAAEGEVVSVAMRGNDAGDLREYPDQLLLAVRLADVRPVVRMVGGFGPLDKAVAVIEFELIDTGSTTEGG